MKTIVWLGLCLTLAQTAWAEESSVVATVSDSVKKGAEATEHGLKTGAAATERGLKKGGEAAVKGVKKAGEWVGEKLQQGGEKLEKASQ